MHGRSHEGIVSRVWSLIFRALIGVNKSLGVDRGCVVGRCLV